MSDETNENEFYVAFVGAYATVDDARADFDGIKEMHASMGIGPYDGALFTKEVGGKVKILDRDSSGTGPGAVVGALTGALIGLIFPASLLGGAAVVGGAGAAIGHLFGSLKRKDIAEIGEMLDEGTAGIVIIGVATPDMGAEQVMKRATKAAKRQVDADAKDLKQAIDGAAKS